MARASDISRKKIKISRGFQGHIREKIANFRGFSWERSQNSWKNRPVSQDFRGKKVKICGKIGQFRGILAEKFKFRRIFRGKFLKKLADFTGNFGGKLRQETISKFRWIFFGKFR